MMKNFLNGSWVFRLGKSIKLTLIPCARQFCVQDTTTTVVGTVLTENANRTVKLIFAQPKCTKREMRIDSLEFANKFNKADLIFSINYRKMFLSTQL